MFSKCFRGEYMWQLRKNLKGWWCGSSNVNDFDYFPVSCAGVGSVGMHQLKYNNLRYDLLEIFVPISPLPPAFFSLFFLLFVLLLSAVWLTRNICANLSRCHLRFFHSSFYSSFSFSWEKRVIFLHCSKIEADLKEQYLVYGIFFWPETWRGSLYILLPPLICQIPDFNCIERFWFLFWSILNGVTLKTSNCIVIGCFSLLPC